MVDVDDSSNEVKQILTTVRAKTAVRANLADFDFERKQQILEAPDQSNQRKARSIPDTVRKHCIDTIYRDI